MIRWTPAETKALAEKFLEARIRDMMAPITEVLTKAMEAAFPPERRRDIKAFSLLNWEAQNDIKMALKQFEKRYFDRLVASEAAPVSAPLPTPEPEVKVWDTPSKPAGTPFVIEFRVPKTEKPDLTRILAEVPTPVLYGFALDRLLKSGVGLPSFPKLPPEVVRVEAVAPVPEPIVIKAASVVDPSPAEDGRRRVLVLGLLPTAQSIVQEKSKNLLRIDATFCDANTRNTPAVVVDYAVIMDGLITRFQVEQIQKKFSSKDRVIHCDTVEEVMRKLVDLNSMS